MMSASREALQIVEAREEHRGVVADFVRGHLGGRIFHTLEGYRSIDLCSNGTWQSKLLLCLRNDKLVAVLPYAIFRAHWIPVVFARSEMGPLVRADELAAVYPLMLNHLASLAREQGCCRIELNLYVADEVDSVKQAEGKLYSQLGSQAGFQHVCTRHDASYWVTLGSDENMLAGLSKKCRRDFRKGLRDGVTTEFRTDSASVGLFYRLYASMCGRKALPAHAWRYFEDIVQPCVLAKLAAVFLAKYQGQICNMAVVSCCGRPEYWLGAAGDAALLAQSPPTGQVLHFSIMQFLRDRGYLIYDLGGTPGSVPEVGHPNYGVWRFKHEFGGRYIVYLGSHKRVLHPARDVLADVFLNIARLWRKQTRARKLVATRVESPANC